jgi:hypothetical protein
MDMATNDLHDYMSAQSGITSSQADHWKQAINAQTGITFAEQAQPQHGQLRYDPRSNQTFVFNDSGGSKGWVAATPANPSTIQYHSSEAICFRLRVSHADLIGRGIEIRDVRHAGDEIHVIIAHGNQTIIMKDVEANFPSDDFIVKLRLLL